MMTLLMTAAAFMKRLLEETSWCAIMPILLTDGGCLSNRHLVRAWMQLQKVDLLKPSN